MSVKTNVTVPPGRVLMARTFNRESDGGAMEVYTYIYISIHLRRRFRGPPKDSAPADSRNEPAGRGVEPVPPAARGQPGRLVPVGRRGARASPGGGPADPALDRLQRLPLVSRHGPRVVRGPGDRGSHERALRQREGGPRGAARPRRDLHGCRPRDDRQRRLADDRLPHAGGRALLRRHLLPARAEARAAELSPAPRR